MTILNYFRKQRQNRTVSKQMKRGLSIERVEDRTLMAADVMLTSGGVIEIEGTDYDDSAHVEVVDDKVRLNVSFEGSGWYGEFPRGDVDRIVFIGAAGDDSFVNDTDIRSVAAGGEGNDTLIGGSRGDELLGGVGDDWIAGRGGPDELRGGKGHDMIDGGPGKDAIHGASGNDMLMGGDGPDAILAGAGDDIVLGGKGDDVVSGEAGYDYVDGGPDKDVVFGGDQMDIVTGVPDIDEVRGGRDADLFLVQQGDEPFGFDESVDTRIDVAATDAVVLNMDQLEIEGGGLVSLSQGADPWSQTGVVSDVENTAWMVFITPEPERIDIVAAEWGNPDLVSLNDDNDPGKTNPDLVSLNEDNDPGKTSPELVSLHDDSPDPMVTPPSGSWDMADGLIGIIRGVSD